MIGWFVTGTDTGVGKTYVSTALARRARHHGARVFAFKPIETGCEGLGSDQRALVDAAGGWQQGDLRGIWSLARPVAPRVAAEAEGATIDLERVSATVRTGAAAADFTIVEGAGGWRVPLGDSSDIASLARALALPVIVVARAGLGTINHSLLTLEAVERDGCRVGAVVLSVLPTDSLEFARSNAAEIGRSWRGRIVLLRSDPAVLDPLCSTWNTTKE